jgi:hypothetical protein
MSERYAGPADSARVEESSPHDDALIRRPLLGRVVVVAGHAPALATLATALVDAGALVAFVAPAGSAPTADAQVRADPADPQVWERIAPHVEQRLGPVDGVVTDATTRPIVEVVFGPDLLRRGHGAVIVGADLPVRAVVSALLDMP